MRCLFSKCIFFNFILPHCPKCTDTMLNWFSFTLVCTMSTIYQVVLFLNEAYVVCHIPVFLYSELFLDNHFGFNFIYSIQRTLLTVSLVFNIKFHWNLLCSFADKNIIMAAFCAQNK